MMETMMITEGLRSHYQTCPQRVGAECECGAFEHNEQVYNQQPPPAPESAATWNVQAIDDDYDGVYDSDGVLMARVPVSDDNRAQLIVTAVNNHAAMVAALELAAKVNPFGSLENAAARDAAKAALAALARTRVR